MRFVLFLGVFIHQIAAQVNFTAYGPIIGPEGPFPFGFPADFFKKRLSNHSIVYENFEGLSGISEEYGTMQDLCRIPEYRKGLDTWMIHVCTLVLSRSFQPQCMPQRRYPYRNKEAGNVKGVILMFHGYTG
jgi:hypothetical protein